jgi:hypothetical protein
MNDTELRGKLGSLHELLAHSPAVDAESRQLLRTLLQDIEKVLEQPSPGTAPAVPAHANRLEEYASRFDADHPALSGLLRQVVDILGRAGI